MKESVSIAKAANVKEDSSPTRSKKSALRVRTEPERQLGSLKDVIDTINLDGTKPSADSIATELSVMPTAQRASALLGLQHTHGNRYVQQVVREISTPTVQSIQRQDVKEEEEEELLQGKFKTFQRQELEEEDELLQGKFASGLTGTLQAKPEAPPNKTGMPDHLKAGIENISGMDISGVRVHYNSSKPAQLNALAYTLGQEIHVASGQEKHLPHEGWHAVQQKQGRVKPTMQVKGVAINDDEGLEREADVIGKRAGEIGRLPSTAQQSPVQRQELEEELMQGKMIETATSPKVMQKMAVMAVDKLKDQEDPLVWNNIEYAVSKATGPIGDLKDNKVWDQLDKKEEIRIVEHGEVGEVGGLGADKIADSMFTAPHELPLGRKIGKITFQSCYAGMVGGAGSSLVSDMVGELTNKGQKNVPVVGRTGIAFGFKGMGEATAETATGPYVWSNPTAETMFNTDFSTDPHRDEKGFKAYCDAMYELRDKKTKTTNKDIFCQPFELCGYQTPWDLLGITKNAWDVLDPDERSNNVAAEMEPYWKELKTKMEGFGGFKPSKTAIKKDIKKSGCFLTTACIEAKGLPEDCDELTTLRAFRDGYMSTLSNGEALISEYYETAPQILARVKQQPNAQEILAGLYDRIVESGNLIKSGKNEEALQNYSTIVLDLKGKYL